MITLNDINKAILDNTSSEDFVKLLEQYGRDNPVSDESKQLFRQTVAQIQQPKLDK